MRRFALVLFLALLSCPLSVMAQGDMCRSYAANTPEDELMQGITGAESPQGQIAALDKYAQAHGNSSFMPCVNAFYTNAYFKLNNYDKVIEYGEKALSLNNRDLTMMDNIVYAYIASGKLSDSAFDIIAQASERIKADTTPSRSANMSDADWQKAVQDAATQAGEWRDRFTSAFLQLLPRVPEAHKRLEVLDNFSKTYPETLRKNASPINYQYAIAYAMANQTDKADEAAEKAIAADPSNVEALNLVAYDYAIRRQANADKAGDYAKKALQLTQAMKKPEGVPDDQFKRAQNNQLGMAHLTLGYLTFSKGAKTHKVAPAIQELKTAIELLDANPQLQGQALFYLGYAYEEMYPADHQSAIQALTRAASLQSPWQGQAKDLLAKVRRAAGR